MSDILVVGSLAYDSIQTPQKKVDRCLGGSANYFSLAASLFSPVRVVGVVGEDYADKDIELLTKRGVDTGGMERTKGKTFHWVGEYRDDMNEAITHETHLNVFEHFNPKLPENYRDSSVVFLANIQPDLQMKVLDQVRGPKFVAMDTMNLWIDIANEPLKKVLKKVDALLINEGEAKQLTGRANAISAVKKIGEMGPKIVVIKRGEYGFLLYMDKKYFILPAFPVENVVDPTGAGDTFAGGFLGYVSENIKRVNRNVLKEACVHGCILASFTVQGFGVEGISKVTREDLDRRLKDYTDVVNFQS